MSEGEKEVVTSVGEEASSQFVTMKTWVLSGPSLSHKISWPCAFEGDKNQQGIADRSSVASAVAASESLYYGVPLFMLIKLTKRKGSLSQVTITPASPTMTAVKMIAPVEMNPWEQKIEMSSVNQDSQYLTLEIRVKDRKFSFVRFVLSGLSDRKRITIQFRINIIAADPFVFKVTTKRIGNAGFFCQTLIRNCMAKSARDVVLMFKMPSYLVSPTDSDETEPVEVLMPNNTVSRVFQMEYASKQIPSISIDCVKIQAKWKDGAGRDCSFDVPGGHEIEVRRWNRDFPLQIEMIGSPQSHSAMVPFNVRIAVHNSSKDAVPFSIDVLSAPDHCLVPYGPHYFESQLLSGESPRFDFWFVGLRQGLLLYPEFVLHVKDGPSQVVSIECGVLILP